MARVGSSSRGKLLVMAMLVMSVAGGRPSSPTKPPPRQQSCAVFHPGMEGRVGHNDNGTVCCPLGCGECGGIECRKNLPRGLSGEDCCVTGVLQSQGRCSDRGAKAPCIIKRGPGKPSRATKPGPPKKKPSPPKKKPSPPKKTPSPPKKKPSPPKKKPSPPQRSCHAYHPGMKGRVGHNDEGTVCCPLGCGECGGIGCRKNLPRGLSGEDCCVTGVLQSQGRCSDRGAKAPCIIKRGPGKPSRATKPGPPKKKPSPPKKKPSPPKKKPSPPKKKPSPRKKKPSPPQRSCHAYHPGMKGRVGHNDEGTVCCPLGCGECGGIGCRKNLPRGLSGEDCCVTGVLQSQGRCSDRGAKAPCIIKRGPGKPSRATKPGPPKKKPSPPKKKPSPPKKKPSPPKKKPSPRKKKPSPPQRSCHAYHPGMKGRVGHNDEGTVCCPLGCGECGGIGCRKNLPRGLSGEDCCVTGVLQSQGRCSDRGAKAPCIIKRGPGKPSRATKPGPPKKKPSPPKKKPSPPKKKPSPPKKKPSPRKKKPSPPQRSCHAYHPGMKGRVGHNDEGTVCCPLGCGECGGIGCRKNLPRGLSGEDCCVTGVLQSQGRCSDRGAKAPCIIKRGPGKPSRATKPSLPKKKPSPPKKKPSPPKKKPSPPKKKPSAPKKKPSPPKKKPSPPQKSCHAYHPGMKGRVGHNDEGTVCCPLGCGECGGIGCRKNLPRGLSGEDCCVTGVLQSQGRCSDRGAKAPCIIKRGPGKPSRATKPSLPKKKPSPPKKKPSPPKKKPSPPKKKPSPPKKKPSPPKKKPSAPKKKPSPPKNRPSPPQKSCDVYHPGMEGRVGHNDEGTVCCPLGCGECGGIGCRKNLPRGLSGEDCCVTGVLQSQGRCSDRGAKAPCIIKGPQRRTGGHKK